MVMKASMIMDLDSTMVMEASIDTASGLDET